MPKPHGSVACHTPAKAAHAGAILAIAMIFRPFLLSCLALTLSAQSVTLIQKKIKDAGTDCEDREFRVNFRLPLKWTVNAQYSRVGDDGASTTLNLRNPQWKAPVNIYYRTLEGPQPSTPEEIAQLLQTEIAGKIDLRTRQKFANYQIPAANCQPRQVGDRAALSCTATFTTPRGEMSEYLTWIRSEKCLAQVWTQATPDKIADVKTRLEPLIQSLRIP